MKYETFRFGSDYRKYRQRYSSQIMPQCRIMNQKAGSKFDIKSVLPHKLVHILYSVGMLFHSMAYGQIPGVCITVRKLSIQTIIYVGTSKSFRTFLFVGYW